MRIRDLVWIGSMTACFSTWFGKRSKRQVGTTEATIWAVMLSLSLGVTIAGFFWELLYSK